MHHSDERPKGALRVVLVGTGTGVGKTHVACALLSLLSEHAHVAGLKPVETGIDAGAVPSARGGDAEPAASAPGPTAARKRVASTAGPAAARRGSETAVARGGALGTRRLAEPSDQERLAGAAGVFHVKRGRGAPRREASVAEQPLRSLFAFPDPVSPHLAARQAGLRIDLGAIERWVSDHEAPITVIETAGGLFSPLGHGVTNFELMQAVRPTAVLLVASDRLGVLHELTTTLSLAAARGGPSLGVVLSAPARKDASTGRNAMEIATLGIARPVAVFPRAPVGATATADAARRVITWVDSQA